MHAFVQTILWIAPALLTAICLGVGVAAVGVSNATTRIRFGALVSIGLIAVVAGVLHIGYFVAPFWWEEGKRYWALGLMLPLALTVLFLILVEPSLRKALLLKRHRGKRFAPVGLIAPLVAVALVLYWTPPALMLVAPHTESTGTNLKAPIEARNGDSTMEPRSGGSATAERPAMP